MRVGGTRRSAPVFEGIPTGRDDGRDPIDNCLPGYEQNVDHSPQSRLGLDPLKSIVSFLSSLPDARD
jgi:hypothetical protein